MIRQSQPFTVTCPCGYAWQWVIHSDLCGIWPSSQQIGCPQCKSKLTMAVIVDNWLSDEPRAVVMTDAERPVRTLTEVSSEVLDEVLQFLRTCANDRSDRISPGLQGQAINLLTTIDQNSTRKDDYATP